MKYLIVDDNKEFASVLYDNFSSNGVPHANKEESIFDIHENTEISKLASQIIERLNDNKEIIIFLNINLLTNRTVHSRHQNNGIILLIWLRIKGALNHCVLYSFESLHDLLNRQPDHLIITSKGTTYIQLPNSFKKITSDRLCSKHAEIENLKQLLKSSFNIDIKHRLANIYGLWFIYNVYNNYFTPELDRNILSIDIKNDFHEYQLSIANFLIRKSGLGKSSERIYKIVTKINELRRKVTARKPRILYIDDQADIGWASLIKRMLFLSETDADFHICTPHKDNFKTSDGIQTLKNSIKGKIRYNGNYIDCILLDLRLADEEGIIDDLDNLSGIKILKFINELFPSIPVIMTTASNKAKSVKKVIECGADSLWTKPGLEDIKDDEFYLLSYLELISYVDKAVNKFINDTEKFLYKTECELYPLLSKKRDPKPLNGQFSAINIILSDTTIWKETKISLNKYHKAVFSLTNRTGCRFIVIDDVTDELFRTTKRTNEKIELKKAASFSLRMIEEYKKKKWVSSGFGDVKEVVKKDIIYKVIKIGADRFQVVSEVSKIHAYYNCEQSAQLDVMARTSANRDTLHADDTFKCLIPYFIEQGKNVLFITNDKDCKQEILNMIFLKFGNNSSYPPDIDKTTWFTKIIKITKGDNFCLLISGQVLAEICLSRNPEPDLLCIDIHDNNQPVQASNT